MKEEQAERMYPAPHVIALSILGVFFVLLLVVVTEVFLQRGLQVGCLLILIVGAIAAPQGIVWPCCNLLFDELKGSRIVLCVVIAAFSLTFVVLIPVLLWSGISPWSQENTAYFLFFGGALSVVSFLGGICAGNDGFY